MRTCRSRSEHEGAATTSRHRRADRMIVKSRYGWYHMHAKSNRICHMHTLGPHGTNLEAASHEWLRRRGVTGTVHLHSSIEEALGAVPADGQHAVTACR